MGKRKEMAEVIVIANVKTSNNREALKAIEDAKTQGIEAAKAKFAEEETAKADLHKLESQLSAYLEEAPKLPEEERPSSRLRKYGATIVDGLKTVDLENPDSVNESIFSIKFFFQKVEEELHWKKARVGSQALEKAILGAFQGKKTPTRVSEAFKSALPSFLGVTPEEVFRSYRPFLVEVVKGILAQKKLKGHKGVIYSTNPHPVTGYIHSVCVKHIERECPSYKTECEGDLMIAAAYALVAIAARDAEREAAEKALAAKARAEIKLAEKLRKESLKKAAAAGPNLEEERRKAYQAELARLRKEAAKAKADKK